ncbi:MAG: hypothetical protein Q7K16_02750, partial [Candidatus Azambacteria bacterium]|nr:hypothetical protein [Candidatus Azambacteria bacterium]
MSPQNHIFFKLLGVAVALCGIILNPFILGKLLTTDGQIEQISFLLIIFIFQGIFIALGLYIFLLPKFLAQNWRLFISLACGAALAFIVVEFSAHLFLDRPAFGWYGYPSG